MTPAAIRAAIAKWAAALRHSRVRPQDDERRRTKNGLRAGEPEEEMKDWLAEIEARANAATAGPWTVVYPNKEEDPDWADGIEGPLSDPSKPHEVRPVIYADRCYMPEPAEMEFMANARADIPRLLAEVRHLRALLHCGSELLNEVAQDRGGWSEVDSELTEAAAEWRVVASRVTATVRT